VEKTPFPLGADCFADSDVRAAAGIRDKASAGNRPAISIVGALIIGDAGGQRGHRLRPVVIIVALTAVCGFVNTSLNEFITIYRLLFLLLGGVDGADRYRFRLFVPAVQAASAESFGVSILDSFSQRGGGTARSVFRFGR
jgi:spore germination protein KA